VLLFSSNVNDGGLLLVTEARQRFALFDLWSAASLLNEGINDHVSNRVEMVKQSLGLLVRKVGKPQDSPTPLGCDAACLLWVRTG
jgi:hypothetical protein